MNLGIMQPYLFPYIGYFQLINIVDKFVIYDDVHFIKQGWINRNQILGYQKPLVFTVPLQNASSFKLINDIKIHEQSFKQWSTKFFKTLTEIYRKAPLFETIFPMIEDVFNYPTNLITELCKFSIKSICTYLKVQTDLIPSSTIYGNGQLSGSARVIDICHREKAQQYINFSGGTKLYNKNDFLYENIELFFIKSKLIEYKQFNREFVPGLSIIDVLMFNSKEAIQEILKQFELF